MVLIVGGSYQGKTEYAKNHFPEYQIFDGIHLYVKQRFKEGIGEEEILKEISEKTEAGEWVLISEELGNGIVPMDEDDTKWREITGRILIELAREAEQVYRVVLGMGQRIK